MVRGTTPKHTFILPFSSDAVKKCEIIYQQHGETVLTKTESDCDMAENEIAVKLTQAETFAFGADEWVDIQLRILTFDGEVLASKPMRISVTRCLSEEVLA